MAEKTRTESDSMGEMRVPESALYGAQTLRAADNFPISGQPMPWPFLKALALIKKGAALVNRDLGLLDDNLARAIAAAADEVIEGGHQDQFPVDVFQTGSGTSSNMNMNEVLANRAIQTLGGVVGSKTPVHPNDHVNQGQSSNDAVPTAIHVAAALVVRDVTLPGLRELHDALEKKSAAFSEIVKIGRTHLQDAVPMTLGQEFGGYARQVELGIQRIESCQTRLQELALGGTAVGTGINAHPEFASKVIGWMVETTGIAFTEATDHFEAQGAQDACVELSGALKTVAVSLTKIANDVRILGSGPRCGIAELILPATQPGSSIMPGKVNPVIAESLVQACAQVIGNDTAITHGGIGGFFELNVSMPLIARNLLESCELIGRAAGNFGRRCIDGLKADTRRIEGLIEQSLMLATPLAPVIGYDAAAKLAKEAHETGKTIRQVALDKMVLPVEELQKILDPSRMARGKKE